MLDEVRITDLGVIEDALLDLHPGLTVVTGETGAGKTMVVTGLGLLLGARADSALVRRGASRAVVEGLLDLPAEHPALVRAAEAGADTEDALVLVRSVGADGRSRAHVGGRSTPVGVLGELAPLLVAVHGQADQWRLRQGREHLEVLDAFGGDSVGRAHAAYREIHDAHRRTAAELDRLTAEADSREAEVVRLRDLLDDLEVVDPRPGEAAELRVEDERLSHVEELRTAAETAHRLLSGDDETYAAPGPAGVAADVAAARTALAGASRNDPVLEELEKRLADLGYLAADLGGELASYLTGLEVDPLRLGQVQQRRATLAALERTHGRPLDELIDWSAGAAARVLELEGADDRIDMLRADVDRLAADREAAASVLSSTRRAAATALGARITEEVAALAMPEAVITVVVTPTGRFAEDGADTVEILLASGSGAPPRSIVRAASGGELARVMLAIEVATARERSIVPTFVFDEVDAGVGGRAAVAVGSRLARLADHAQVVVVTHLAQVAAHADRHLVVEKTDDGTVTRSGVRSVEGEARVRELARMLSGSTSEAALDHARDLWRSSGARGLDTP